MERILIKLTLLGLLISSPSWACDIEGKSGILPENDLSIGINDKNANSDMTEEIFNAKIEEIQKIYAPIVREKGGSLVISGDWNNNTVNAYAQQVGDEWKVSMFGGLARHKTVTPDGFADVICHELGHHLGGAPKKTDYFGKRRWASNEGQSDYWAQLKCLRRYFEKDNNVEIIRNRVVPEIVKNTCESQFTSAEDVAICIRGALAGHSLASLFASFRNTNISFSTPDPGVVRSTSHNHPAAQCRLDTYYYGALCNKNLEDEVDNEDETLGVCARVLGDEIGNRPLCWFKPKMI